ncbi:hypothetical protein KCU60_g18511, partial [Aureobasidium melanogenum]
MAVNANTSQFLELDVDRRAASPTPGTSLPEDDGMRALRQKMHEIRSLAASTEEKARAMHLLMTRDYITMNNPDHEMPDLFQQGPLSTVPTKSMMKALAWDVRTIAGMSRFNASTATNGIHVDTATTLRQICPSLMDSIVR